MRLLRYGPRALLVEVASTVEAVELYAAALADRVPAAEIVPAARTVLFDGVEEVEVLAERLRGLPRTEGRTTTPAVLEVPTVYDGADLSEVARQWSTTEAEVVALHTSTQFTVAFCGFSPGFGYCTGLPAARQVARRTSPRPRVPAGSVALAGGFSAVYPSSSPGGWQLIGRTDLRLWDPAAEPPALLTPGARVRFREVSG